MTKEERYCWKINAEFIAALKKHSDIMVRAPQTRWYFRMRKMEAFDLAKIHDDIRWEIRTDVYKNKRAVVVIY